VAFICSRESEEETVEREAEEREAVARAKAVILEQGSSVAQVRIWL
jgi:hypothetical protein